MPESAWTRSDMRCPRTSTRSVSDTGKPVSGVWDVSASPRSSTTGTAASWLERQRRSLRRRGDGGPRRADGMPRTSTCRSLDSPCAREIRRCPCTKSVQRWVVRRLAPDSGRVKLASLPKGGHLEDDLLRAMGHETANVHVPLGNVKHDFEDRRENGPGLAVSRCWRDGRQRAAGPCGRTVVEQVTRISGR